jgi:Transmembrane secretion effector
MQIQPPLSALTERESGRVSSIWRALRHRNFQLFFGGQLISLTGTWMQSVAQSWLVYRLTGCCAKVRDFLREGTKN